MSELKPCPFCGGSVKLEEANPTRDSLYGERRWWGVVCRNTINLGGSCAIQQRPSASKEAAIERWNRRAQPAQTVPASCGECGKKASDGWALYCVACMEEAGLPGGTSSPPLTHSRTSSLVRTADSIAQAVPLLSDEEMVALWQQQGGDVVCNFGRAIEAAVLAKVGIVGKEGGNV